MASTRVSSASRHSSALHDANSTPHSPLSWLLSTDPFLLDASFADQLYAQPSQPARRPTSTRPPEAIGPRFDQGAVKRKASELDASTTYAIDPKRPHHASNAHVDSASLPHLGSAANPICLDAPAKRLIVSNLNRELGLLDLDTLLRLPQDDLVRSLQGAGVQLNPETMSSRDRVNVGISYKQTLFSKITELQPNCRTRDVDELVNLLDQLSAEQEGPRPLDINSQLDLLVRINGMGYTASPDAMAKALGRRYPHWSIPMFGPDQPASLARPAPRVAPSTKGAVVAASAATASSWPGGALLPITRVRLSTSEHDARGAAQDRSLSPLSHR